MNSTWSLFFCSHSSLHLVPWTCSFVFMLKARSAFSTEQLLIIDIHFSKCCAFTTRFSFNHRLGKMCAVWNSGLEQTKNGLRSRCWRITSKTIRSPRSIFHFIPQFNTEYLANYFSGSFHFLKYVLFSSIKQSKPSTFLQKKELFNVTTSRWITMNLWLES